MTTPMQTVDRKPFASRNAILQVSEIPTSWSSIIKARKYSNIQKNYPNIIFAIRICIKDYAMVLWWFHDIAWRMVHEVFICICRHTGLQTQTHWARGCLHGWINTKQFTLNMRNLGVAFINILFIYINIIKPWPVLSCDTTRS